MADTDTSTDTGYPAVPLLANSYDFQALEAATLHAEGLKRESNQDAAFGELATKQALNQDVIAGLTAPAVPEGTELADVEGADGRVVTAPVAIVAAEDDKQAETLAAAAPSSRRARGDSPAQD